ncbi:MAG: hypothetical protein WD824_26715 [Cyclobacteriaceae bacterium]
MMKRGRTLVLMIVSALLVLWSSCTDEEHSLGTARVEATFGLNSRSAMAGKITVEEAFLKLDRIQILGSLGGNNNTNVTHTIAPDEPPYNLTRADSSHADFNLTSRVYDQLDFHLFMFQDQYELKFIDAGPIEVPEPEDDGSGGGNGDQDDDTDSDDDGENDSDDDDGNHDEDDDDQEEGDRDEDDDDNDDYSNNKDDDKEDKGGDKGDKDKNKNKNKGKGDKGDGDDDDDDDDKGGDKDDDDDDDDRDNDDGRTSDENNSQVVDLDHFFQNAKPGMAVFGIYENNGKVINIIFIGSGIEKFNVRAKQNDADAIVLGEKNIARMTFDPDRWFESITAAAIESARLQVYQQQTVLFVHKDYNTELFQMLAPRIEGSANMNITAGP